MKKDGIALPASIDEDEGERRDGFYARTARSATSSRASTSRTQADPRNATLTILRKGDAPVLKNDGAEAWDLGDGILGLTFKTKANSIDPDVITMLCAGGRAGGAGLPRAGHRQRGRALLRRREPVRSS